MRFGRSEGQTLVEFALVLPLFMFVVIGVFEFGRAITYWHDLNNTAQVAARYAVVNRYPGCPGSCSPDFVTWAKSDLNSSGLRADSSTMVRVCYKPVSSGAAVAAGDPVTVIMSSTFKPIPIMTMLNITLRGKATLRMEQNSASNIGITDGGC